MKYYIIAGETSGDLYGGSLMEALLKVDPQASFRFWGGDNMLAISDNIAMHIRETSFMGFTEVLMNIRKIRSLFAICKNDISSFKPDTIIFIDYPGFNLRMAKWAKKQGYFTQYFIPPKVWAWKEKRLEILRNNIDKTFAIFPFEIDFYKRHNMEVSYYGNPLTDFIQPIDGLKKSWIGLLPGSRKQEITRHLPIMLKLAANYKNHSFKILKAPNLEEAIYQISSFPKNVSLHTDKQSKFYSQCLAAIVCSGTATLETALYNIPQVVMYKAQAISYAIAKRLVTLPYISLVNLIADKELVKELIQSEATVQNLKNQLDLILKIDGDSMYSDLKNKMPETQVIPNIAKAMHTAIQ